MFNLLPEKEKKAAKAEYGRRRLIIALAFFLAVFAVGAITLVPSYVVSFYRLREINQTAEALQKNIAIKNQSELNDLISSANKKTAALLQGSGPTATAAFAAIASHRSQHITIEGITLGQSASKEKDKDKKMTLAVRGKATDRETLTRYAKELEGDPMFMQVDLPISNLARERDIDFSLIVTVK